MLQFLLTQHSVYSLFKIHWIILGAVAAFLYSKKIIHSPIYSISPRQKAYFFIAFILILILKGTPLDVIGNYYLFSVHVLQIALILFVVIPLFILSFPISFYRRYVWNHRTKLFIKILSHPWLTLISFNGLLSIYFIPVIFNAIHSSVILTTITQILLIAHAIFMWWVIIQPLPELRNFDYILRAAYIFFASLALFPIGFYFIIVQEALFPVYMEVSGAIIPPLTPIYDQQLAGGLLKIIQMFTYAYALLFIMFSWGKQEQTMEGQSGEEHIRYVRGVVVHLNKDNEKGTNKN